MSRPTRHPRFVHGPEPLVPWMGLLSALWWVKFVLLSAILTFIYSYPLYWLLKALGAI